MIKRQQLLRVWQEVAKMEKQKEIDNLPLASWKPHPPPCKELPSRKNLTKALRSKCEYYGALYPLPQQYWKGILERIIGGWEGGWKSRSKRLAVVSRAD